MSLNSSHPKNWAPHEVTGELERWAESDECPRPGLLLRAAKLIRELGRELAETRADYTAFAARVSESLAAPRAGQDESWDTERPRFAEDSPVSVGLAYDKRGKSIGRAAPRAGEPPPQETPSNRRYTGQQARESVHTTAPPPPPERASCASRSGGPEKWRCCLPEGHAGDHQNVHRDCHWMEALAAPGPGETPKET